MALPEDGYKRELLDGEIVMSPGGITHGMLIARLMGLLWVHVDAHGLGTLFDGQTGFRMKSLDVLSPDISFVSRDRPLKPTGAPATFFEGAPDLAIEVLSPSETKNGLRRKLDLYFENGTRLAWVVDPRRKTVFVHRRAETADKVLEESDNLSGEDVVPGFVVPLKVVFAGV